MVTVGANPHLGCRLSSMRVLLELGQKNLSQLASLIRVRGLGLLHPPQGLLAIGSTNNTGDLGPCYFISIT